MARWIVVLVMVMACSSRRTRDPPRPHATLRFEIRDTAGRLLPARISLVAVDGTPPANLARRDRGELVGRTLVAQNRIMSLDGEGAIEVPQGIYDIVVSRGIEWTLARVPRVAIGPAGYTLRARLDHVIDTTGWLSGDFHVHAAPSHDSRVPLAHRVIEFVTSGVDLIVSTDHNVIADYAPTIRELGAEGYLASMIGDEITTWRRGHFNIYPLSADRVGDRYGRRWRLRGGATRIFPAVRRDHPGALIQVNHPRRRDWMGYFFDEHFDRNTAQGAAGFSLDFDTIEVMNGRDSRSPVETVLLDWFVLLDHGFTPTAMGNSDTHDIGSSLGGYPRTYVAVPDDRPGKADAQDVVDGLRAHRAFFTTGPILSLRSGEAGIGDVASAPDGRVTLQIEVVAAPWIAVDTVTLYVNGQVFHQWSLDDTQLPQRLETEYELVVDRDSYIVLRADGAEPMWPVGGDADEARIVPIAVTNPLFVDADGDGRYGGNQRAARQAHSAR